MHTILVWVLFLELPLKLFDEDVLYAMGNAIGHAVKIDDTNLKIQWGKYARVCIEVELAPPLVPFITILGCQ